MDDWIGVGLYGRGSLYIGVSVSWYQVEYKGSMQIGNSD